MRLLESRFGLDRLPEGRYIDPDVPNCRFNVYKYISIIRAYPIKPRRYYVYKKCGSVGLHRLSRKQYYKYTLRQHAQD